MTKAIGTRLAATVLLSLALLLAPAAFAGKGKGPGAGSGGGGYTVTVDQAGPYWYGQALTVTTNAPVYANSSWIDLGCYQGGAKVLATTHAAFEGGWYYGWAFNLGPTAMWTGGAADCELTVWHQSRNKRVVDARTTFRVDG